MLERKECEQRLPSVVLLQIAETRCRFRWVELQLDVFLNPNFPIRHPKDVQAKLDRLRRHTAHESLNVVYEEMFEVNTQDEPHVKSLVIKALKWVLCTYKPLSIGALVEAVALDSSGQVDSFVTAELLLQACSNFIILTRSGCTRFAHRSVQDFLLNSSVLRDVSCDHSVLAFSTDHVLRTAHTEAAVRCTEFLLSLGKGERGSKLPTSLQQDAKDLTFSAFEMYACFFWLNHCSAALQPPLVRLSISIILESYDEGVVSHEVRTTQHVDSASTSYQKWVSLLWRVFHTKQFPLGPAFQQRLEDAISEPADPMFAICIWGSTAYAKTLLRHNPSIVYRKNIRGKTALLLACEYGHQEIVQILLDSGTPTKDQMSLHHTAWGTPLQAAAWGGHLETFEVVLGQSRDINHIPKFYGRLLDACIYGGNDRITALALREGVEVWLPQLHSQIPAMGARPAIDPFLVKKDSNKSKQANGGLYSSQDVLTLHDLQHQYPHATESLLQRLCQADSRRLQLLDCYRRAQQEPNVWPRGRPMTWYMQSGSCSSLATYLHGNSLLGSLWLIMVNLDLLFPLPLQVADGYQCPCCYRSVPVESIQPDTWRYEIQ